MGLDNPIHLAILLMVLLLVFGAKRLPAMGRSLGSRLRGFKEAVSGEGLAAAAPATAPAATEQLAPAAGPLVPAAGPLAPAAQPLAAAPVLAVPSAETQPTP